MRKILPLTLAVGLPVILSLLAACSERSPNGLITGPSFEISNEFRFSRKLAFASGRDGVLDIFVINTDGTNLTNLTNSPFRDQFPDWSPDGTRLVFRRIEEGNFDIYVMNADGSDLTRLTADPGIDSRPSWSPDGQSIVFHSSRDGDREIYVMQADGSNLRPLTQNDAQDWVPSWSPDGQKIVFTSNRDGNDEIYVMAADGSNPVRLTENSATDINGRWSPDGQLIAFASDRDGNREVYIMRPDGTRQRRLTNNDANDDQPTWLSNSLKIAFHSRRDGNFEIYTMTVTGLHQTNITNDPATDVNPRWQVVRRGSVTGVPDVLDSLASVYAVLHNTQWSYYNLSEIASDEMIVPIRGSDWFDNGRWLEMQRHTWTANSPSGLDDIDSVWTDAFSGITRANVLLDVLQNASVPNQAVIEAELRTLRAFYYYMLLDMFGGVPIVTIPEIEPQPRNTRAELFQFIESELQEARTALPDNWPAPDYARMTKGAADAILASLYLNAGVFTADAPGATTYNSCTAVQVEGQSACDAAIAAANRILNSGQYNLATDWHSNFAPDNFASPENILVVENLNQTGLGLDFVMRALHYNQLSPSPWNGFAALAETYNAFDADDQRREIFLEGPQVNLDTGEPAFDRSGNPLVFTVDIIDETQAGEGEGARIIKWPPDPNRVAQDNGNDFAYFRLGEILLIKAEALNELNPGSGEALALLNALRERVFEPDEPLTTVDRDVILRERLLELTAEAKRRQDLIRHGRFTDPWSFKQQGAPHLVLMPIPQPQLEANPLLAQNPGY